jgi:CheY-like chemotaxis protein
MTLKQKKNSLRILLADDDADDRYFFDKALKALSITTHLSTVQDGKKLMDLLLNNSDELPDVLFLDLNMPLKNGSECLEEIKSSNKLKILPVVIYSTSLHEDVADLLFQRGAHYYVRKTDQEELEKILFHVLSSLTNTAFAKPPRSEFVINTVGV